MNYEESIRRLDELINYEVSQDLPYSAENYDLERFRNFLVKLGSPEKSLPALHVAGTKGKGSTCMISEAILGAHGLNVGTYLSPHIHSYRERIRIHGHEITPKEFAEAFEIVSGPLEEAKSEPGGAPTHFEVLTAIAFVAFREAGVDVLVLEVGLGGRLDATNVCKPASSVIMPIGLEHTAILGDTIRQIAREKAGIIRKGIPVFNATKGEAFEEIVSICVDKETSCFTLGRDFSAENIRPSGQGRQGVIFDLHVDDDQVSDIFISAAGPHQALNAAVAISAVEPLLARCGIKYSVDCMRQGLSHVQFSGRFEIARFKVADDRYQTLVLDGAHTRDSAAALTEALKFHFPGWKHVIIAALLDDKDSTGFFTELAPVANSFIVTATAHPRCAPVEKTAGAAEDAGVKVITECDFDNAFKRAIEVAGEETGIVITGSFSMLGSAKTLQLEPEETS